MSNIGCRVFTKVNRPPEELVAKFRGMPVANIADCAGRIATVDQGLVPFNKCPMLGVAFTVKCSQGDNLFMHKALDMAKPGDIIVVAGFGEKDRAVCGEIMMSYAITKGIKGFIIDGAIRDSEATAELTDFPVYARSVQPNGPYKNGVGEINVPVSVGGIVIFPGDILVGDPDGIIAIRPKDAEDLYQKTTKVMGIEKKAFEDIAKGVYNRDWVDQKLSAIGCEILDRAWDE